MKELCGWFKVNMNMIDQWEAFNSPLDYTILFAGIVISKLSIKSSETRSLQCQIELGR